MEVRIPLSSILSQVFYGQWSGNISIDFSQTPSMHFSSFPRFPALDLVKEEYKRIKSDYYYSKRLERS